MGELNPLKLKHRNSIQEIVRTLILKEVTGHEVAATLHRLIKQLKLPADDSTQLLQIIETEIMSLHDGNIARFKIRPSEFRKWKRAQAT